MYVPLREDNNQQSGGISAFSRNAQRAPAPIRNSEEKQFADKMAGAAVDTALKNTSGQLLGSGAAGEAVTLGATNLGTLGTALQGVGSSAMAGGTGMGAALGGVGSAMLPFAGPLALAALPFLLKEGDTNVANDDDMDSKEISAMNQAYNGMNIWGLKGGTHKVAGIDPQNYSTGTGGAKNPPGIRTILGANPMQTAKTVPSMTPSQLATMGASGMSSMASSAPRSAMSIHEIFRPTPGSAPSNYNPFASTAEAGRQVQKNIKANEIRSMFNNLQNQENYSVPKGTNVLSSFFRGGPIGLGASLAMAPTMAADATIQDPRREEFSAYLPPLAPPRRTDRQMKEELHDQKMRQNDEVHRAKLMAR